LGLRDDVAASEQLVGFETTAQCLLGLLLCFCVSAIHHASLPVAILRSTSLMAFGQNLMFSAPSTCAVFLSGVSPDFHECKSSVERNLKILARCLLRHPF